MNWGNRLLVIFVCFGALIGTLVYKCTQENFELVSKNYYNDELKYQDKIDGMNNANKISEVKISTSKEVIQIQLPKELNGAVVTGDILFYCAPNSRNDLRLPLQVNEVGIMTIARSNILPANYLVKLNWQVNSNKYYHEQPLAVQ